MEVNYLFRSFLVKCAAGRYCFDDQGGEIGRSRLASVYEYHDMSQTSFALAHIDVRSTGGRGMS
jgi:hypothetical protein